jgi:hypothetical protein
LPILPWACAHGDAPAIALVCAPVVAIAPADDSVDSNDIAITGFGAINSFGACPYTITKKITFSPDAGKTITLTNSAALQTLLGANRVIAVHSIGSYHCDGLDNWTEISFTATGSATLEARVTALESAMTTLQNRVTAVENRATSLETRMTALEARVTKLENPLE